jgi:hypothetical protein
MVSNYLVGSLGALLGIELDKGRGQSLAISSTNLTA